MYKNIGNIFLILCHPILTFNNSEKEKFWKHHGERKMLVTSIFSFSHNVLYLIKDRKHHFFHVWLCKCFKLSTFKSFSVWKDLNIYTTNFKREYLKLQEFLPLLQRLKTFKQSEKVISKSGKQWKKLKAWSNLANGLVTDKKLSYPYVSILCFFFIWWIHSLWVGKFSAYSKISKGQRRQKGPLDVQLLCGLYAPQTNRVRVSKEMNFVTG